MKSNILITTLACAAMAIAAPALAKPGGGGGGMGGGMGGGHGMGGGFGGGFDTRINSQGPTHASGTARVHANSHSVLFGSGAHVRSPHYPTYGHKGCARGLTAKSNGCLPPGQASRTFTRGQRVPTGYEFYTRFSSIPLSARNQIPSVYLNGNYRYIYRGSTIYVVNPTTRRVADIIAL